jgi:hypothetical protein
MGKGRRYDYQEYVPHFTDATLVLDTRATRSTILRCPTGAPADHSAARAQIPVMFGYFAQQQVAAEAVTRHATVCCH